MGRLTRKIWVGIGGVLLFLSLAFAAAAQDHSGQKLYATEEDRMIFERYREAMGSRSSLPIGELMIETARFFLNVPYVASTLEMEPEGLVVNLRELDCTTLAETVLALSRTIQSGHPSFESYCDHLRSLRYRGDSITDYTDRLHYMTDWFYENGRKGIVEDVTRSIGGIALPLELSFISTHPDSYKQLKSNPAFVRKMAAKEKDINARAYFYLPKAEIDKRSESIWDGDILCFVTTIKGLDVTHVGIACWQDGILTFIHASSSAKSVIVQPTSLREYTEGIKSCKGILIARPLPVH